MPRSKKDVEREYLEMARRARQIFPLGDVQEGERPDFRILTPSGSLGVEVTKLYPTAAPGEHQTPRERRAIRHRTITEARRLFQKGGGPEITVEVFFSSRFDPSKWKEAAKWLALFVEREHQTIAERGKPFGFGVDSAEGFHHINIRPSVSPDWLEASESDRPRELDYPAVNKCVEDKNQKLTGYQAMPDGMWLLMVVDPFPRSDYYCVPRAAISWEFQSNFDKVLLYSRERDEVLEFGKV